MRRLLAFVLPLALTACDATRLSSDVDQDRIFARYELIYDEANDRTVPRASFRLGDGEGALIRLEGDASVQFEGEALQLEGPQGLGSYDATLRGLVSEGSFRYTGSDGRAFVNTARVRSIALPSSLPAADRDAAYEVTWEGGPVGPDEEVRLALYQVGVDARVALASTAERGATSVSVPRSELRGLRPGEATVLLTRFTKSSLEAGTRAGGEVVGEYGAPQQVVPIVD